MKTHSRRVFRSLHAALLFALASLWLTAASSAVDAIPTVDATLGAVPLGAKPTLRVNNDVNFVVQFWLASVPKGTNIEKAMLRLWVSDVFPASGQAGALITIFSAGDNGSPINETTVTKDSAPATIAELGTLNVIKPRKSGFILLDVTDYVRPLTANSLIARPAFIIKLADSDGGSTVIFDSKENPATSHGPILELVTGPMFAVVGTDGTIARSSPGVVVNHVDTGSYEVLFPRDVTQCAYTATIGGIDDEAQIGLVSVARRTATPNGVFVLTRSPNNDAADLSFHLTVTGP